MKTLKQIFEKQIEEIKEANAIIANSMVEIDVLELWNKKREEEMSKLKEEDIHKCVDGEKEKINLPLILYNLYGMYLATTGEKLIDAVFIKKYGKIEVNVTVKRSCDTYSYTIDKNHRIGHPFIISIPKENKVFIESLLQDLFSFDLDILETIIYFSKPLAKPKVVDTGYISESFVKDKLIKKYFKGKIEGK